MTEKKKKKKKKVHQHITNGSSEGEALGLECVYLVIFLLFDVPSTICYLVTLSRVFYPPVVLIECTIFQLF